MVDISALEEREAQGEAVVLGDTPPEETPEPVEVPEGEAEAPSEEPEGEEEEPEPPVEEEIPPKYKGKSLAEVVRMHQEAEARLGQQGQEVGDARQAMKQAAQEVDAVTSGMLDALALPVPSEEEIADQTRTLATQRYQQLAPHRNLPLMPDDPGNPASWLPEERALWEEVLVTARDKVEASVLHDQTRALMERSMGSATVKAVVQRQIETMGIKGVAAEKIVAELPPGATLGALTNPQTREGTLLAITRLIQAEAYQASLTVKKKAPVVPAQAVAGSADGMTAPPKTGAGTYTTEQVTRQMNAQMDANPYFRQRIQDAESMGNTEVAKRLRGVVRQLALDTLNENNKGRRA